MIRVSDLSFAFGDATIFDGVDVTLPPRGLVALTGPNGAGKTTLLRILGRVYRCQNVALDSLADRCRMTYLDSGFLTLDSLTVRELMHLVAGSLGGVDGQSLQSNELLTEQMWPVRLADLSLGQRQRCVLAVARALTSADVILLDEPLNGLDREALVIARRQLVDMARDHTVLFATHDATDIHQVADCELRVSGPTSVTMRCTSGSVTGA